MVLEEFRKIDLTWDKATRRIYDDVRVASSDENGRKLVVQVLNGGQVEDLSGVSLNLYWETGNKKRNGLDAFDVVDASKGIFEIYFTTGMLSNIGKLVAHLQLVDSKGTVTSELFTISVFRGVDNEAIESSDSFSTLAKALVDVTGLNAQLAQITNNKTDKTETFQISREVEGVIERIDNLIIPISPENSNIEVTDAKTSITKGKDFDLLGHRFEEIEKDVDTFDKEIGYLERGILYNEFNLPMEIGGFIIETGEMTNNNTRIRHVRNVPLKQGTVIGLSNYDVAKINVSKYDFYTNDFIGHSGWKAGDITLEQDYNVRIFIAHRDDRVITNVSDLASLLKPLPLTMADVSQDLPVSNIRNIIKNGDGSLGVDNWDATSGLTNVDEWISRNLSYADADGIYTIVQDLENELIDGHKYYLSTKFKVHSAEPQLNKADVGFFNSFFGGKVVLGELASGEELHHTGIYTATASGRPRISPYIEFDSADGTGRASFGIKYVTLVDITETFGGEEPTLEELDRLFGKYPNHYFDGYAYFKGAQDYIIENLFKLKTPEEPEEPEDVEEVKSYMFSGELIGDYEAQDIDVFPAPVGVQHSEVYDKYDSLMSEFPDYITSKELLGNDEGGKPLYVYKATPHKYLTTSHYDLPKVIITSGTHGNEKGPVYSLYNFLKDVCTNWKNDKILEFIRFNIEFVIVPIVNPSGFDSHKRENFNNVDLNRNFPTNENFTGKQLSTQYVGNLINENADADLFIDYHNMFFRDGYMGYGFVNNEEVSLPIVNTIATLGRTWQSKYDFFPQADDHEFGYTVPLVSTMMTAYAERQGIKSGLLEIVREINWQENGSQYDELTVRCGTELLTNTLKALIKTLPHTTT